MPKTQPRRMPAVAIVPAGWWALADAADYYPEDLPEDWRLGYYANEYPGVYVPFACWGTRPAAALRNWRADVHERFGLFLEQPPDAATAAERLAAAREALGPNLVANVRWAGAPATPGTLLAPAPGTETPVVGQALRCPPTLRDDLRAAARWLKAHAAPSTASLVVLPAPTSTRLGEWRQLAALLGFAELSPADG